MKPKKNTITSLAKDIIQIVKHAHGEEFDLFRLCRDHNSRVTLEGNPVFNITQNEFADLQLSNFIIDTEDVYRLGIYCELNMENIVALLLKAKWEKFIFKEIPEEVKNHSNSNKIETDSDFVEKYMPSFNPVKTEIYNLISNNKENLKSKFPFNQIHFLIEDLLQHNKFLQSNDSLFSENEVSEQNLLFGSSLAQKEEYFRVKEVLLISAQDYEELNETYDAISLQSKNIQDDYYRVFGYLEEEKKLLIREKEMYKIMLEQLAINPNQNLMSLEKFAKSKLIEIDQEINDIRKSIKRSQNFYNSQNIQIRQGPNGHEIQNYKNEYNKLRNILRKLLHPDTCPDYDSFSPEKKRKIDSLWNDLLNIHERSDKSFSPEMLGRTLPDILLLKTLYKRTCKVLGMEPEDFELEDRLSFLRNNGASVKEIIQFMNQELEKLRKILAKMEINRDEYTHDSRSQTYLRALENRDMHSAFLEGQIKDLKKLGTKMTQKINNKLKFYHERK